MIPVRRPRRALLPLSAVSCLAAATLGLTAGCGGGSDMLPPPPPPPAAPPAVGAAPPLATATTTTPPLKPPAPAITLTAGAASPDPAAPAPTVKLTAPTRDQVIGADKAGEFQVKLDAKNWQTAPGSNHVHLILDNKPYKAIYDTKAPVRLNELAGGEALAEGLHVLAAFPSRANHESVKTKDALTIVPFWVGKKGDAKADFTKKPLLVYSRPKGEYKGEMSSHVLVDFQLANVTLAEGKEHVTVSVTGPGIGEPLIAKVDKFGAPLYVDNLQTGEYALKVELVDGSGKLAPGPWNSTTRTIKVDQDAQMDMSMAPATTTTDAGTVTTSDAGAPKAPAPKPAPAAKDAGAPKK